MRIFSLVLFSFCCLISVSQEKGKEAGLKTINKQVIQSQLEFLSSDWMEGREAGTSGNYLAGDYLGSLLKLYQLKPGGDEVTFVPNRYQKLLGAKSEKSIGYFQSFSAIENKPSNEQYLTFIRKNKELQFQYKTDFGVSFVTQNQKLKAELVFVGYGFESKELAYNEFENVNIDGKIIVRLSGLPGDSDADSKASQSISGKKVKISAIEKNTQAFEKGALAVLEYDPLTNVQNNWNTNEAYYFNEAMYEGDEKPTSFYNKKLRLPSDKHTPPVLSISKQMFEELLAESGVQIEAVISNAAELKSSSTDLSGEIVLEVKAETKTLGLRNILGIIEGENPDKIMVVGAHYDHLGKYNGQIFNGADDNGSGVVAVTTIAKAFMESGVKPKCTIVFALWDGEERGLLGSRHFIETFKNIDKTVLYLNFDMVGRNGSSDAPGNKVAMIYTKAYQNLVETSKAHINDFNLNLDVNFSGVDRPVGGSDNSGFARIDVPIFWFHTGGHTDYHKASDHVELINWQKLEDIIKLSYLNMWEFANNPGLIEE